MGKIYKNGQAYASDEWRSSVGVLTSKVNNLLAVTKSYTIQSSD